MSFKENGGTDKNCDDVITRNTGNSYDDDDDDDGEDSQLYFGPHATWWTKCFPTGFMRETKSIMKVAWGMIFTQFCISTIQPIATMFGGHLGKLELEAIGLSNTIVNITGTSIGIGASTACTTLFSQTYGAKNYKLLGILFQKGLIIMIMTILPCYAIHLNLENLLILCGQDHEVASGSSIAQDLTYLFLFILCVAYMLITQRFAYAWHGLMSIGTMTVYACLRYQLPKVFTDDPETIELTAALIPICLFYNFCDFQAFVKYRLYKITNTRFQ